MKTLIVGARPGGLGDHIKERLGLQMEVKTAGISPEEDYHLDVNDDDNLDAFFGSKNDFDNVVCTVGINEALDINLNPRAATLNMARHLSTNVLGPFAAFRHWLHNSWSKELDWRQFVFISSNSATLPRSSSAGYCASKAALSMMVRCTARDLGKRALPGQPIVYGYEFGMLAGTPMSRSTDDRFAVGSRMLRQPQGLSPSWAAQQVVNHLLHPDEALAGCMLRYDENEV